MSTPLLLMPYKPDPKRDAVAEAWQARGWDVLRLDRFWEPPALASERAKIYGGTAFAHVLAQKLGLELISPPDSLMLELEPVYTSRRLTTEMLSDCDALTYPVFVKPLVPKLFDAAVFPDSGALRAATTGLEATTELLISDIVSFVSEYRCWCLQARVLSASRYEGLAQPLGPDAWLNELLQTQGLSGPLVVDVGYIPGSGWAVVEFNACWGAGLNGASASAVVDCIVAATRPG